MTDPNRGPRQNTADTSRADRSTTDRNATEDRELTDAERLAMFRASLMAEVLPTLPKIPGYETVWLTTTNPYDPIPKRMRLGYEPVQPKDVPGLIGLQQLTLKTGEYTGFIAVNEMLAFKLPTPLWKEYMAEAHHHRPNEEEGRLRAAIEAVKDQAEQMGARVDVGDGIQEILDATAKKANFE